MQIIFLSPFALSLSRQHVQPLKPQHQPLFCFVNLEMDFEEMEMEMVLEKILDLHDEVNDSIHAISRSHFLQSVKAFDKTSPKMKQGEVEVAGEGGHGSFYSSFSGSRMLLPWWRLEASMA